MVDSSGSCGQLNYRVKPERYEKIGVGLIQRDLTPQEFETLYKRIDVFFIVMPMTVLPLWLQNLKQQFS